MPASPAPTFYQIAYHSGLGLHTQRIGAREWTPPDVTHNYGSFVGWDNTDNDADDMVESLVALMLPFYPSTVVYDNWTLFTQASPTADPVPRISKAFTGAVGSAGTPGWSAAVQTTITARSENFGLAKLVLLDSASSNDFSPGITVPGGSPLEDLLAEWFNISRAWQSQDDARPAVFIKATRTLNESLRRRYRLD